jgi:hypothetical protein
MEDSLRYTILTACVGLLAVALVQLVPSLIELWLSVAVLSALGMANVWIRPNWFWSANSDTKKLAQNVLSLRDLFYTDFPECLGVESFFRFQKSDKIQSIDIPCRLLNNLEAKSKFMAVYIPAMGEAADAISVCTIIAKDIDQMVAALSSKVAFETKSPGDSRSLKSESVVFTRVIYVYVEQLLSISNLAELEKAFDNQKLEVTFRGHDYHVLHWRDGRKKRVVPNPETALT